MPSARPGNTADTAWAVLPPARAPGTDPRSPTRQAVRGCLFLARLLAAPSDHADSHGAAAGSRATLAGQRFDKSSRLPRASSETRARSVPMSAAMSCASHFSESRELGAELLLERDRATRKRSRGAARVEPVGRTPAHRASCGQSLARAGCQSASRWQYCPGSIGSIARSRGDTLPRQARATIPYPPVRTRETYDRSNTRNASSTLPNGADTCTPCTASLTRSNISCAIAIPSATACSFDFSFA